MIELISKKVREEWHLHKCPLGCKQVRYEPNTVCGKSSGDHVFACLSCLQSYRLRMGTDILLDAFLTPVQAIRLENIAPDAYSKLLDARDRERADTINKLADKGLGPLKRAKPVELHPDEVKRAKKEHKEHLLDTATRMTQDEAVHELEKIDKKEKF